MKEPFKFRKWPPYKDALSFRKWVLENLIPRIPESERFEITSQLKRALNSIILNIAEGAYRSSDKDFAHFLNQSVTSVNEVVACFDTILGDGYIDSNLHREGLERANGIVRQIVAFHKTLVK